MLSQQAMAKWVAEMSAKEEVRDGLCKETGEEGGSRVRDALPSHVGLHHGPWVRDALPSHATSEGWREGVKDAREDAGEDAGRGWLRMGKCLQHATCLYTSSQCTV